MGQILNRLGSPDYEAAMKKMNDLKTWITLSARYVPRNANVSAALDAATDVMIILVANKENVK